MSRWDAAVLDRCRTPSAAGSAIAIGLKTYKAYRELIDSDRWQRLANEGARLQRLLWASTGTKDPECPDTLYVRSLSAPRTINTMPESTLVAFNDHGTVDAPMPTDGGDADATLGEFASRRRGRRCPRGQAPVRRRKQLHRLVEQLADADRGSGRGDPSMSGRES